MGVDIAGDHLALILHVDGGGEGLATRRGTAVQHPLARRYPGGGDRQPCRRILHVKPPLLEGGQPLQIPRAAQQQAPGHPRVGRRLRPGLPQLLRQLLQSPSQGIDLGGGRGL